ncbi:MAG TPA: hypothetical protein PKB12_04005 [Elusimicrobiota bacterium]|nr:hypothetical protein [Elusimicrobiota bacterium]
MKRLVLGGTAAILLAAAGSARAGFSGPEDLGVFADAPPTSSTHFRLHHEDPFVPAGILNDLEGLHAKLLLDLGVFSPWAYSERIDVYLYKNAESYAEHAHMPAWSAAHIDFQNRKIYGYPSAELKRTLAHEMGHLFFMQYFVAQSATPPLWLNEGVAMLMEWDYGGDGDAGQRDRFLMKNRPPALTDFFKTTYQGAGNDQGRAVSLWYAQAGSVTRFLMRRFSKDQFVRFCAALREGKSVDEALPLAYGLAVSDAAALDRLWRESVNAE